MSVNISKLKQQKIRKTFSIGTETVEVYNITNENKQLFEEMYTEHVTKEAEEIVLTDEDLLFNIYKALTNIEFDNTKDMIEALESPSIELEQINNEIRMIITEYVNVRIQEQLAKIQELEMLFNQAQLTMYTENVVKRAGAEIMRNEESAKGKTRNGKKAKKK